MDAEYYKEYFHLERANWWFLARLKILENQIKTIYPGRYDLKILNVGVATGATSEMLEKFGSVKSIEYDEICFRFVKEHLTIDIEKGSILDLNFEDNTFDLVCAFDVIEHVEDDKLAVSELTRVSKLNGVVLVTVPAFMELWSKHDEINFHFRRYVMKTLVPLFDSKKGQIIFKSYFNTLLFVPIYTVRVIANKFPKIFKRNGSGSDHSLFKLGFLNKILFMIFYSENIFLENKFKLPFGVSIILAFKKNAFKS